VTLRPLTVLASATLLAAAAGCTTPARGDGPAAPAVPVAPVAVGSPTDEAPTTEAPTAVPTKSAAACRPAAAISAPATENVPPELTALLGARLADPRFDAVDVSASVWMEGYGEVATRDGDRALYPASNQKLLTAVGALSLLPADGTFTTVVRAAGITSDGVLEGDLMLVGGGDPSLTRTGAHSLDALAAQVREAGIRHVTGAVVADESRQESARTAAGWQDWQIPTYAGPLSALTVDDNRFRTDASYLADPAVGNAGAFIDALRHAGVSVDGAAGSGIAPPGALPLASLRSRPYPELVAEMLLRSDNEIAEMLLREIGVEQTGEGTTAAGVAAVQGSLVAELCLELPGHSGDGSGLSRDDRRSARELRMVFQAAMASPWGPAIDAALPVAARSGTLAGRFKGTAAAGNLHAKTGSIIGGRALTGHLRSAGGREVVFSVLVNGERSAAAQGAIDALVIALAAYSS
jgi:D-alanyl-D-alanine carboxypeptidase/D-alanyl-D-alanine-endopeptidase (penicillin-binding protein 4)